MLTVLRLCMSVFKDNNTEDLIFYIQTIHIYTQLLNICSTKIAEFEVINLVYGTLNSGNLSSSLLIETMLQKPK